MVNGQLMVKFHRARTPRQLMDLGGAARALPADISAVQIPVLVAG